MHLDVPELDHKRPFYYDVVEVKPFTFTSASSRTLIQIELLLIFLRGGGQLWTLEKKLDPGGSVDASFCEHR